MVWGVTDFQWLLNVTDGVLAGFSEVGEFEGGGCGDGPVEVVGGAEHAVAVVGEVVEGTWRGGGGGGGVVG